MIQTNSQAQFRDFVLRLEANKETMKAMTDAIKPVLDLIDPQLPEPDLPSVSNHTRLHMGFYFWGFWYEHGSEHI